MHVVEQGVGGDGSQGFEYIEEREVEEKGLKLSITDRRERRKEQRGPSFRECSEQGFVLATSVETLAKEKVIRMKCGVSEILAFQENRVLQKNFMRIGGRNLWRTVLVPAGAWRGHAVGFAPTVREP